MFRLIFLGFLLYFAYKLLSGVFRLFTPRDKQDKQEVKGKSKKPPLDLGNADVEDVDFKDIE